jgi:hypothetical protein
LLAGKKTIIRSGVMTETQYLAAEKELLSRLQSMRENESGIKTLIPKGAGSGDDNTDSFDDDYNMPVSTEHQSALTEWSQYKHLVKTGRYFPRK